MSDPARWFVDRVPRWELALLAVVAILGIVGQLALRSVAFPTAPVDLSVSRAEAEQIAADALRRAGGDPDGLRVASRFLYDGYAARFFHLAFDREAYEAFIRSGVPIWFWSVRLFAPGEPREWRVTISPGGEMLGFTHHVPADDPGGALSAADARALAESYMTDSLKLDPSDWEPMSAHEKALPRRADHGLVWKRRGSDTPWPERPEGEPASVRLYIDVQGDGIGGFRFFARTPEAFDREFRRLRQMSGLAAAAFEVLAFVFVAWIFFRFLRAYKHDDLNWPAAICVGVGMGILYALYAANRIPNYLFAYDTAKDFWVWIARIAVQRIGTAAPVGLVYALGFAAIESIGREVLPRQTALFPALGGRGLTSAATARAIWIGYLLGGVWLCFGIVYHALAKDLFGVWSPLRSPYSGVLVNFVPALSPMVRSLNAGMAEEALFRLAGFALLYKTTRRAWIAVLVPAFVWSLAHAGYDFIPFYTRFVELTLVGALMGFAMLRYGIVPCIVSHYVYDAVVMNVSLLESGRAEWIASAAVVIALPAAVALFGTFRAERPQNPVQ